MNEHPYEIGRVTISKQGHDKGRAFLIVGVADERYVWIADGDTRKIEHPKKKQWKHLRTKPFVAAEIAETIARSGTPQDCAIRKALERFAAETASAAQTGDKSDKEECALVQE